MATIQNWFKLKISRFKFKFLLCIIIYCRHFIEDANLHVWYNSLFDINTYVYLYVSYYCIFDLKYLWIQNTKKMCFEYLR